VRGLFAALSLVAGCTTPSPLVPHWAGSIGLPHRGVLTGGAELPEDGDGFRWLRKDERHYGLPRFTSAIERAAATVAHARPGAPLFVGDLSRRAGGQLLPHLSHRSGRDADLLLFLTTLDGVPVRSPGFLRVGPDGLAYDEKSDRFLRFDVEREWLLVKSLVEDDAARIQWIFVHRALEAMLIEWAEARGEPAETILRAELVMAQPGPPAEPHDDHVHVRTACAPADITRGCEPNGPEREWLLSSPRVAEADPTDEELVAALLRPIETVDSSVRRGN
jgi:penicillin-insensitive murein endopeptidase